MAFWGGVFAGTLGLNVDEDPLRGWLQRTAADAQVFERCLSLRAARRRWGRVRARLPRSASAGTESSRWVAQS